MADGGRDADGDGEETNPSATEGGFYNCSTHFIAFLKHCMHVSNALKRLRASRLSKFTNCPRRPGVETGSPSLGVGELNGWISSLRASERERDRERRRRRV